MCDSSSETVAPAPMPTEVSEGSECEGDAVAMRLPRSQSERLLAINREHVAQERELREKYHDLVSHFLVNTVVVFNVISNYFYFD